MNDICIRIKELRNKTGMSQVEFAKRLGVTNAHISKIEKGGTVPSYALIKLIAKEYKVKEDWMNRLSAVRILRLPGQSSIKGGWKRESQKAAENI